jgi:hypothetical protein
MSHGDYSQKHFNLSRIGALAAGFTRVNVGKEFNAEHCGELRPAAARVLVPALAAHIRSGKPAWLNQKKIGRISEIQTEEWR